MANRFSSPSQQFADATGTPYAGGSLTFYASGTSTPQATYSDSALSVPNANPVVLDSAGRAGNVFLSNLSYKVVLADSTGAQVWTADPVWSSDFSTVAQLASGNGNPNGARAGSAGSPTVNASQYWDATNNILYVCTVTGNIATAVWTAINASTAAAISPAPTGRLTLTSATPVLSSDVVAATAVIYTPYVGNTVPIFSAGSVTNQTFTELTLTLSASHTASTLYDVFIFNNGGVLTLATGPAWTNSTAGASARGSGAGTTQLSRINGLWFNAVSMTGKNGANTYTIGANLATYLGTIYTDATAGQVTSHISRGQNRKAGVWNAFNRVPIALEVADPTASWAYATATIRASNNAPATFAGTTYNVGSGTVANGATILTGLPEIQTYASFAQGISTANEVDIGVGLNSITAFAGMFGLCAAGATAISQYTLVPSTGINVLTCLEQGNTGASIFGAAKMSMRATYLG